MADQQEAPDDGLFVDGVAEADEAPEPPHGGKEDPDEYFRNRAFRVIYQTNNFFLPQIKELITDGSVINIRPEYQRRLRWSSIQKSRLIESMLLNVPIPPIFLYETSEARYEVMDGQQRLNAIKEYLEGSFVLTGMQILSPLNGLHYTKSPPRIKRALDRANLSAIVLLLESDSEKDADDYSSVSNIRRFVFERLNTGGKPLNAQEIRNAIYAGHFNRAIVELSRNRLFTEIFGIPPYTETDPNDYYENPKRQKNNLYATMGDCQLILRYFAIKDSKNIRGSMKSMLDRAMWERLDLTEDEVEALKNEYVLRLEAANNIFGPNPFVLPLTGGGKGRISAALYDATLVALHRLWRHRNALEAASQDIKKRLLQEYADEDTLSVLTGQGNTAKAVRERISLLERVLLEGSGLQK